MPSIKQSSLLFVTIVTTAWSLGANGFLGASGSALAAEAKINADRDNDPAHPGVGAGRLAPYKAVPAGYGDATIKGWVDAHRAAKGQGFKYVYIPAEVAGKSDVANELRVAAGKAWNNLSWKTEIDVPQDISDGAGLVFALDANKVWGADAELNWGYVANCSPKPNIGISPAEQGDCAVFPTTDPVAIPRFVFNATNGGPYANVHKTPPDFGSFTEKFQMSPIKAVSTQKEAIVCGPRMTAYRTVKWQGQDLLYSYTSDEFNGRDQGTINYDQAPTDNDQRQTGSLNAAPGGDPGTAIASEWWIQLPNGFLYYSIHGEGAQERGKAEYPFAIDPANWKQNASLTTGRSCITCHSNGIQSAPTDKEFDGKKGWTSNTDLKKLYDGSRGQFQKAMRTLVDNLSDGDPTLNERMVNGTVEPIARALILIEGPYPGAGNNGTCEYFCNGKFGAQRRNLCDTLPSR